MQVPSHTEDIRNHGQPLTLLRPVRWHILNQRPGITLLRVQIAYGNFLFLHVWENFMQEDSAVGLSQFSFFSGRLFDVLREVWFVWFTILVCFYF